MKKILMALLLMSGIISSASAADEDDEQDFMHHTATGASGETLNDVVIADHHVGLLEFENFAAIKDTLLDEGLDDITIVDDNAEPPEMIDVEVASTIIYGTALDVWFDGDVELFAQNVDIVKMVLSETISHVIHDGVFIAMADIFDALFTPMQELSNGD